MSIQRQAMSIMTRLYAIYPDLEKQLSYRAATNLLSAMAISGMFLSVDHIPNGSRYDEHMYYVTSGIRYELDVRAIARSLGIDEHIASKFIRGCFVANKSNLLYPCTYVTFGSEYEAVARHLNLEMVRDVIEYLAGNHYTPSGKAVGPMLAADRERIKYGTFYLLKHFIKLEQICNGLPAKQYFLEVINFIQSHPDRKLPKGEFTPRKIFIDEIVDYAREYDEARFERFYDEIATMLLGFDDCSTLPDCQSLKSKLGLFKLHEQVKTIHDAFANFIESATPQSDAGNDAKSDAGEDRKRAPFVANESESSADDNSSDHESEGDVAGTPRTPESEGDASESEEASDLMLPAVNSTARTIFPRACSPRPQSPRRMLTPDQQFDEDVARAIELSLRGM